MGEGERRKVATVRTLPDEEGGSEGRWDDRPTACRGLLLSQVQCSILSSDQVGAQIELSLRVSRLLRCLDCDLLSHGCTYFLHREFLGVFLFFFLSAYTNPGKLLELKSCVLILLARHTGKGNFVG